VKTQPQDARVWPLIGLALLTGGVASAGVAQHGHNVFAVVTLVTLSIGVGCALFDEVRNQARRASGWTGSDTANALLLGLHAALALGAGQAGVLRAPLGSILFAAYAALCAYFIWHRRRTAVTADARVPRHGLTHTSPDTA
jgi:hypothetical protein